MTNRLYDSTYLDQYENSIIWDDTINAVLFYTSTGESWDRTGGGTTSWSLENTLPYDSFYGNLLSLYPQPLRGYILFQIIVHLSQKPRILIFDKK